MATTAGVNIKSQGTTRVLPATISTSPSAVNSLVVAPSPAVKIQKDVHQHTRGNAPKRFFLGPMPEKVVVPEIKKRKQIWNPVRRKRNTNTEESHDETSTVDTISTVDTTTTSGSFIELTRERLFRYFLGEGGRTEDWDESVERGLREDISQRWRESGWHGVWNKDKKDLRARAGRWVGKSFEIGNVLGLQEEALEALELRPPEPECRPSLASPRSSPTTTTKRPTASDRTRSLSQGESSKSAIHPESTLISKAETFVTAQSEPTTTLDREISSSPTQHLKTYNVHKHPHSSDNYPLGPRFSPTFNDQDELDGGSSSGTSPAFLRSDNSTTALIHTPAFTTRPSVPDRSKSDNPQNVLRPFNSGPSGDGAAVGQPSDREALLDLGLSRQFTDGHDPAAPQSAGLRSALKHAKDRKGKKKGVNFESAPLTNGMAVSPGIIPAENIADGNNDGPTADPIEVLQRTGEEIEDTSAGAAQQMQGVHASVNPRDIIMKDRMLVKVSYNRSEGLPHPYDENEARRHPDTQEEDWAEFIVCWRHHHLEIFEDYSIPGKEWLLGRKHLAFVVPLKRLYSHISLYSSVDGTFCITCPPTPIRRKGMEVNLAPRAMKRSVFHRAPSGTNIFVFKCKQRSRAIDWMWNIWLELGGEIPPTVEIHSPDLGSRVRLTIPQFHATDGGPGYQAVTRQYALEQCRKALQGFGDWERIIESKIESTGAELGLCWRKEDRLEWIWLDEDIEGNRRDWAVLYNLAFKNSRIPSRLEVRLAAHTPNHVVLTDGTKLSEPPSVEGYLYRIKAQRQTRTSFYISSHDGNVFSIPTTKAFPPAPPAPPAPASGPCGPEQEDTSLISETQRAALQILAADGYIDLRNIYAIRRATTSVMSAFADVQDSTVIGNIPQVTDQSLNGDAQDNDAETASDAEDEGGDEYLNNHPNKARVKMRRQFEFVMRSGHVVRFEAHSRTVALEWITKLKALISYWTRRQRVDARQEMDLARSSGGVSSRMSTSDLSGRNMESEPRFLGEFWNWCVLSGCRPIVRAGRLFEKSGPYKTFKHKYHVLTHGHIIQFHLTSAKSAYHHRSRTINLIDAYVYSGQLAVASLPKGTQTEGDNEPVAKRYQDGLESYDGEEDVTFIIWYRPHSIGLPPIPGSDPAKAHPGERIARVPPLGGQHGMLILKARSKLERDSWCFALNAEIERLSRLTVSREKNLRETGNIQ